MNNLVVMPLIIPLITGLVLVIFRRQIRLHRLMSLLATLSVSVVAILLMNQVVIDGPQTLQLGGKSGHREATDGHQGKRSRH
jgi:multicomponent Na+:H+ antiporter subunit D